MHLGIFSKYFTTKNISLLGLNNNEELVAKKLSFHV
jgi:hypothetical protein